MARFDNDMTPTEVLDEMLNEHPGLEKFVEHLDEKYEGKGNEELALSMFLHQKLSEVIHAQVENCEDEDEQQKLMKTGILMMVEVLYLMIILEFNEEMGID